MSSYISYIVILIAAYIPICMGVQFLRGYTTNSIPFSLLLHMMVGSYATVVFSHYGGVLGLVIGCGISVILSILCRSLCREKSQDTATIIHFLFALSGYSSAFFFREITNGSQGLLFIDKFPPDITVVLFPILVILLLCFFIRYCDYTQRGKRLQAMRDNPQGMILMGMKVQKVLLRNTIIAGILAVISGYLYIHHVGYIDPKLGSINSLIIIISSVVLVGLRPMKRLTFGVALILILPEIIKLFLTNPEFIGPVRIMLISLLLFIVIVFYPTGIFGTISSRG